MTAHVEIRDRLLVYCRSGLLRTVGEAKKLTDSGTHPPEYHLATEKVRYRMVQRALIDLVNMRTLQVYYARGLRNKRVRCYRVMP